MKESLKIMVKFKGKLWVGLDLIYTCSIHGPILKIKLLNVKLK